MPRISRRQMLKTGAGGLMALTAPRGQSQASFVPYILFVHCDGGWDTTMVFDNKIGSAYVAQETGAAAATGGGDIPYIQHANRPAVQTFFDTYGANAAIVNGLSSGSMVREPALANMLGAVPEKRYRRTDWLSFYVGMLNPVLDIPHAVIAAPYMPGEYTSAAVLITKAMLAESGAAIPNADSLGSDGETALAKFRKAVYTGDLAAAAGPNSLDGDKLRALYYGAAREPLVKERISKVLETLGTQSASETEFVRHGKIAVELFAAGASQAATIQAGKNGLWDTTANHFALQAENFEMLFSGLSSIIAHAATRGVDSKMIVIVTSERGRSPQLNAQSGKGPWAFTSTLLWGAGINGGKTAGLTDAALRGLPIDPVFGAQGTPGAVTLEMGHVMAAIYLKTNVPVKLILPQHQPLAQVLANGV